ncbi:non-specific phospholipase C6 [Perilla frutescens var. frutescens]|nr:non-specific phospholipase C6 [Perilla frutescens var. frutescens]
MNKTRSIFLILLIISTVISQSKQQQPIKTIVILVMENRSFDHMIGWMKKSINPSINGVTGKECNPIPSNTNKKICYSNDAEYVDLDPGHSFKAVEKQVYGSDSIPTMKAVEKQALSMSENLSQTVMKGFKPENLPIYAALVKEFAVFDRWFSSIPGPTQPNRLFVCSATSHGSTSHVKKQLARGYPQQTIFDSLHENGVDFMVYARKGKLPRLTVIEPSYFDLKGMPANDDHPSHDVANGQRLVKEVYEALRASPQWNETLLVITYDEHGGFYDHVKTPYVGVPIPDGNTGEKIAKVVPQDMSFCKNDPNTCNCSPKSKSICNIGPTVTESVKL